MLFISFSSLFDALSRNISIQSKISSCQFVSLLVRLSYVEVKFVAVSQIFPVVKKASFMSVGAAAAAVVPFLLLIVGGLAA